jgi:gamma-glutamyltranspeptidase/glutathione hydrolase
MGGDAFALYWDARARTVRALNGSGRSPKKLTLEKAREMGLNGLRIPFEDANSVTVPGAPGAWVDIWDKWGGGRMTLGEIFEVGTMGVLSMRTTRS